MREARLLGAVLAGGESKRFGRDKAAEVVGTSTLVERAARTLAEVFDPVVIVSSRAATTALWLHVPDLRPGEGPLAGIEAALEHAEEQGLEGAFVLACDMPLVTAETVWSVLRAMGVAAACAPSRGGPPGVEPLCAAYRVSCGPVVSEALDEGRRSVNQVFGAVRGVTVSIPGEVFLNVNRPEDVGRVMETLAPGTFGPHAAPV